MKDREALLNINLLRQGIISSDAAFFNEALEKIALKNINAKQFGVFHDNLLFAIAYAPSAAVKLKAEETLKKIAVLAKNKAYSLQSSGIQNTVIISSFTLSLLKWMMTSYPGKITFHSFDKEKEDISEAIKLILPSAEAEIISNGWGKTKLFRELCGGKISLEKIAALFDDIEEKLSEYVFSQLDLYVEVNFSTEVISRTTARSISYPDFFHAEILKKIDAAKIISSGLPHNAKQITTKQKGELIANARMMLVALGRETDPQTFTSINETEFLVLGRGFSIALFSIRPPHRLAFDAYIGYAMFKNGCPVAYGGAWIFLDRALIGINIFDAYRGGESSFLFTQLLRVYHQRFNVSRFTVEPYQYGKNNAEGISSGAYWFYYRFGFRSDNNNLRLLADDEAAKIKNQKGYRTPSSILKQFTKSTISLELKKNHLVVGSGELSLKISKHIALHFGGNRKVAIKKGLTVMKAIIGKKYYTKFSSPDRTVLENWALVFLLFKNEAKFSEKEKSLFVQMIKEKATGEEARFVFYSQKMQKLFFEAFQF